MRDKTQSLSQESYGLLLLLLSAVLYSFAGVLVKLAANTGLSSSELVLLRALFQGTIVVTSMCLYRTNDGIRLICQPFGGSSRVIKIVIIRGIIGGLGFCLYFYTISVLPLGDATALVALKPVPAIFLGRILLGEAITPLHLVVTITSVVGSILIAQPSFLFPSIHACSSQYRACYWFTWSLLCGWSRDIDSKGGKCWSSYFPAPIFVGLFRNFILQYIPCLYTHFKLPHRQRRGYMWLA